MFLLNSTCSLYMYTISNVGKTASMSMLELLSLNPDTN